MHACAVYPEVSVQCILTCTTTLSSSSVGIASDGNDAVSRDGGGLGSLGDDGSGPGERASEHSGGDGRLRWIQWTGMRTNKRTVE